MRGAGFILLGIWLILYGLQQLFNVHFTGEGVVLGILALAAGVLLLFEGRPVAGGERRRGRWGLNVGPGILLLAIWLILWGLLTLFGFTFQYEPLLMGILALAAGVVLLIRR